MTLKVSSVERHAVQRAKSLCKVPKDLQHTELSLEMAPDLSSPGRIKVAANGGGQPVQVTFRLNPLSIGQDPETYLSIVLPGLVGTAAIEVRGALEAVQYREHGPEWKELLVEMGHSDAAVPNATSEHFDFRANRLFKGDAGFACSCPHDETLRIVTNRNGALKEHLAGEVACEVCNRPFELASPDSVRGRLQKELEFLQQLSSVRGN